MRSAAVWLLIHGRQKSPRALAGRRGLAAAAVSLIQHAMEIALNRAAAGAGVSASATLFQAVNIADTVNLVQPSQ